MVLSGGFIKDEVVLIVSSDPALGASNVRNQGSSFEVQYDGEGLEIPKEAQNVTVSVQQSEVWWNIPNVVPGNDTFYITGPNSLDVPTNYVLVIPKGLYASAELDQALSRELALTDAKSTNGPLINIQGDASTDKTLLKFNYPGVSVDFTQANTPREIMGFNSEVVISPAVLSVPVPAPNTAAYNQIDYFVISSDLVDKGIRINNRNNQAISQIPIVDVSIGSQIVYSPFHPSKVDANNLAGAKRTNMRFNLTDSKLRPVDTNGQYWSARIVIEYYRPMVIGKSR